MKVLKVKSKDVVFLSLKELAKKVGKSKDSLLKLEGKYKILPQPNYRTADKLINKPMTDSQQDFANVKHLFTLRKEGYELSVDGLKTLANAVKDGQIIRGDRLYSQQLVEVIVPLLKQIRQGRETSIEILKGLVTAFGNEKLLINNI